LSPFRKQFLVLTLAAVVAGLSAPAQPAPPDKDFSNLISEIDKKAGTEQPNVTGGLKPPKGALPPSFWERYHLWVFAGAGGLLLGIGGLIWYVQRPLPEPVIPPDVRARRDLEAAAREPDLGLMLSDLSRILRRYITQVFELTQEELTTREFVAVLLNHPGIPEELAKPLTIYLQQCDERKFSPMPPDQPSDPLAAALDLINKTEGWRERQRAAKGSQAA
jgi:hypothetical protein